MRAISGVGEWLRNRRGRGGMPGLSHPTNLALATVVLLSSACGPQKTPLDPTAMPPVVVASRPPLTASQVVLLDETVEVDLSPELSGGDCEIGNDPWPCARFVVDIPRASTAVVGMVWDSDESLFIEVGNLAAGPAVAFAAGPSPLVARAPVRAGPLSFRAGVHAPWGRRGPVVRVRLVVTLG
jgi:hypothetical protein